MAVNKINKQYYSTGAFALDAKMQPVESVNDLKDLARFPLQDRYVGMTVVVLNNTYDEDGYVVTSNPVEYWLVGDILNACWQKKVSDNITVPTYADLPVLNYFLNNGDPYPNGVYVGMERIVLADETNEGKMSKYWVIGIDEEGNVSWERKEYGGGGVVTVEGEDQE